MLKGRIYVIGGWTEQPRRSNAIEYYEPSKNEWKIVEPMLRRRSSAAAGVSNGYIFVFGGIGEDGDVLQSIERYDPNENVWIVVNYSF